MKKIEFVSQFFNQMSTAYWKRLSLESWLFIGYEKAKGSIILFQIWKVQTMHINLKQQYSKTIHKNFMKNIMSAHTNSPWAQTKQNILILKLATLSFKLQKIEIRSIPSISAFFIIQTIFEVILPSILLVMGSTSYMDPFRKIVNMLIAGSTSDGSMLFHIAAVQITLFVILFVVVILLLINLSQRIQEITLYFLTYIYCAATFILFLCTSGYFTFYEMDSKQFVPLLGKLSSIANILILIFLCGIYKLCAQTYSSVSSNQLCPRFDSQQFFVSIARKIISVLMLTLSRVKIVWPQIVPHSQTIFIVCECLQFATALSRFKKQAQYFTYINEKAAKIYRGCLVVELSCIFSTLACLITQQRLLQENYVYSIGLISVLSYLGFQAYLGQRTEQLSLLSHEKIQNGEEAVLFLLKLNQILQSDEIKTAGLSQLFMIKNLFKMHMEKCQAVDCFCKREDLNRDNIDEMIKIYKLMGLSLMENLCQKFQNSFKEIPNFILIAKLNIYNNFIGSPNLTKMSINNKRNDKSFKETLFLKKYGLELQQYLQKKINYENIANIEKCLECDNIYQRYLQKILQVLEYRSEFWNSLTKNRVNSQFDEKVNAQLEIMTEINEINGFIVQNYLNLQLITLIVGYEKNILLKQRITKDYLTYIKRLALNHQKSKLKMYKKYNIKQIMYQKHSCTIEASITQQQLGTIVNTSKNVINVFGYHSQDLLNSNIRKLIPNTMQDQHDDMLKNWIKTCSWERLGQLKNVFGMRKGNICFSCRFYLKPIVRQENVNLIAYFIKDNDEDYMLLSSKNVIVAAGRNFLNMLGPNIINLPITVLVENRLQLNKALENPASKSLHAFNFYSTKSKTSQEMHRLYKGFTISLDTLKNSELPAELGIHLKQFYHETQSYSIKFCVSETTIGRLRYRVIKLQNHINTNNNFISTYNIINENRLQPQKMWSDESNIFLNYDPSISSSSSQTQSASTYNLIERMEKIFYKNIPIYDSRSVKLTVIVLILCVLGCAVDLGKIYVNELGFDEMEELLSLDNTYSYNIQVTMFIYNNVLILDQSLKLHISNTNETDLTQQLFLNELKQHLQQSKRQQDYLYNLITEELVDYNRMRTSLNDISMYQFSNVVTLWKQFEEGKEDNVTIMEFISNFLYFSKKAQGIISKAMEIMEADVAEVIQHRALETLVTELRKNLLILNKNFPTLEQLSVLNLDYHSNLLKTTKLTINIFSYIKMASLILIFFVILYALNQHYDFRQQQKYKIYSDYRYITLDYVIGLQNYLQRIKKLVRAAFSVNDEDDDVEREHRMDINVGLMAKMNRINEIYISQEEENCSRMSAGLKLTVKKQGLVKLKVYYLILFLTIIGLNLLMKSAQEKVITKSEEIVTFINHLITTQNKLMTTYFQYKAQPLTGITLTSQQLAALLQKVKMVEVEFTEVAVGSLQLFAAYDTDYVRRMSVILTESICTLRKDELEADDYDRCLNREEMQIIRHGVVNGMNAFSRKMENLIEEQMKNSDKSKVSSYSMTEIDLNLYSMFKVYQKIQSQIADSLSIAANHQKSEFIIEIVVELLILLVFLCLIFRLYRRDKRDTLFRIGRILLLPISVIKNNPKILKNFQKAIDFSSIKED